MTKFDMLAQSWYKIKDGLDIYRCTRNEENGLRDEKVEAQIIKVLNKIDRQLNKYRKK